VDGEDGVKDLNEFVTAPIPKGAKYPDKKPDLTPVKQPKKFKCLKCGRLVIPRAIKDVQAALDDKLQQQRRKENEEKNRLAGREGSVERPEISGLSAPGTTGGSGELPLKPELCVQPALLPEVIEQTLRPPASQILPGFRST